MNVFDLRNWRRGRVAARRLAAAELEAELAAVKRQRDEERLQRQELGKRLSLTQGVNAALRHDLKHIRAAVGCDSSELNVIVPAIERLQSHGARMAAYLDALGVLKRLETMPVLQSELYEVLKGVTPSTEWWRAVHALINDQERVDDAALCVSKPLDEMAHFNRGRKSALQDLRAALIDHCAAAQRDEQAPPTQ